MNSIDTQINRFRQMQKEVLADFLQYEYRYIWRNNRHRGFDARPKRTSEGTFDYLDWTCTVPGPEDTPWANGRYRLNMLFRPCYPFVPPVVRFALPFYHPNIDRNGYFKIDTLKDAKWNGIHYTIRDLLYLINDRLGSAEMHNIRNQVAAYDYQYDILTYNGHIKLQALATLCSFPGYENGSFESESDC